MNKNLAIRGHLKRGDEVIKILKMLGGKDVGYNGIGSSYYYYINDNNNIIGVTGLHDSRKFVVYSLEEFLEKFPYKVGDKVIHDGEVLPIIGMKWDFSRNIVIYTMKYNYGEIDCYDSTWMRPYKEETIEVNKEFKQKYCIKCGSQRCSGEGEWLEECEHYKNEQRTMEEIIKIDIPKGYKFVGVGGDNQQVVFTKIQPKYPKTHLECCDVLGRTLPINDDVEGYKWELIMNFQRLLVCRDAYWKIAGEQMGLGKPWEPDWKDSNFKYCLKKIGDNIEKSSEMTISCILAFPTEEIRNIFYNNFKNTIEQCKELL